MIEVVGRAEQPDNVVVARWDDRLVSLYRARYVEFVRLAYLQVGDASLAEEIVQDAFVNASRSWDTVRDPAPYLRTSVVNGCRSWGRRHRLERERRPAPAEPGELGADHLWDALEVLNERQRTAIVLRFYEDLPDDEIAAALGCRPATVRTTIHRALKLLRKEIDR